MDITFSDISIESQYSEIPSRSKQYIDISSDLGPISLNLPVVSSNMPDITEAKMAVAMAEQGGLGILHRFYGNSSGDAEDIAISIQMNVEDFKLALDGIKELSSEINPCTRIGVSVGVKESEKDRFKALHDVGARIFCIDIAHGHTIMMKNTITWIRENYDDVFIIAGNIATGQGAVDLIEWGADIVKVGIGPGLVCRTRSKTGVGTPQFTALKEIYEALESSGMDYGILADGGIREEADCGKALIYADAVMVGGVLAGTYETPPTITATA